MLFGCEPPETQSGGTYDITQTTIGGVPAPEAGCKLAFFNLSSGVQLELIEPNGCPSTWKEFGYIHGIGSMQYFVFIGFINRIFRGHVLSQDASAEQYVVFSEICVHNYLCFTLIFD